jgi:hypothetical protein
MFEVQTPAEISAEGCELGRNDEASSALCAYGTGQNLTLGDWVEPEEAQPDLFKLGCLLQFQDGKTLSPCLYYY